MTIAYRKYKKNVSENLNKKVDINIIDSEIEKNNDKINRGSQQFGIIGE